MDKHIIELMQKANRQIFELIKNRDLFNPKKEKPMSEIKTMYDKAREILNEIGISNQKQLTNKDITPLKRVFDKYYSSHRKAEILEAEKEAIIKFLEKEKMCAGLAVNIALCCEDEAKAEQHQARKAQIKDTLTFIRNL